MGREPGFQSIGHATNVADGLALIETFDPDLVTVNVHLGPSDASASIAQITDVTRTCAWSSWPRSPTRP